jgi:hypothetical protein
MRALEVCLGGRTVAVKAQRKGCSPWLLIAEHQYDFATCCIFPVYTFRGVGERNAWGARCSARPTQAAEQPYIGLAKKRDTENTGPCRHWGMGSKGEPVQTGPSSPFCRRTFSEALKQRNAGASECQSLLSFPYFCAWWSCCVVLQNPLDKVGVVHGMETVAEGTMESHSNGPGYDLPYESIPGP